MNNKPKILIVDDRPENLLALEVVLRDMEVELIRANNGNEALKATLHHDFVLALLDVQMPEMDGYELATILREEEKTSRLPFIFISAVYRDDRNIFKGYERGAFSFITKPFRPEILLNKVQFFVEKYQQEKALQDAYNDLQQKNEELRLMNAELDTFSFSASHDLRSPLRSLKIYTQILADNHTAELQEKGQQMVMKIQKNAAKMSVLLDDLLAFSRLGRKEVSRATIDMKSMVSGIAREMSETAVTRTNVHLHELSDAEGDPTLIGQVWTNLISNAIKYSAREDEPEVHIGMTEIEGEQVYYIRDNGVGFDMDYTQKLFGAFQRLHNNTDFEGTGLGLAIAEKIIIKHGGRIWAESVPGHGATFYFTLPLNQDADYSPVPG